MAAERAACMTVGLSQHLGSISRCPPIAFLVFLLPFCSWEEAGRWEAFLGGGGGSMPRSHPTHPPRTTTSSLTTASITSLPPGLGFWRWAGMGPMPLVTTYRWDCGCLMALLLRQLWQYACTTGAVGLRTGPAVEQERQHRPRHPFGFFF